MTQQEMHFEIAIAKHATAQARGHIDYVIAAYRMFEDHLAEKIAMGDFSFLTDEEYEALMNLASIAHDERIHYFERR